MSILCNVIYDGINHSIFEGQVLTPLITKLIKNPNLCILLISFETKPIALETIHALQNKHPRLQIKILKKTV